MGEVPLRGLGKTEKLSKHITALKNMLSLPVGILPYPQEIAPLEKQRSSVGCLRLQLGTHLTERIYQQGLRSHPPHKIINALFTFTNQILS